MTRVLMLGWEFPPVITGGLGTACYGLTKAMNRRGMEVTFLLPKGTPHPHRHLEVVVPPAKGGALGAHAPEERDELEHLASKLDPELLTLIKVPAPFRSPYALTGSTTGKKTGGRLTREELLRRASEGDEATATLLLDEDDGASGASDDYGGDLIGCVRRYARFCLRAALRRDFDVVHAHDWMTYPAGLAIARLTGRPLVVHVHSTEFDRSGEHVNQQVYDIERRGMHAATRVVTVSELTKNLVVGRYGVDPHRVEVVYNGCELDPAVERPSIDRRDRIVLYFGRITYQKGPEYFVQAAKRVLEHADHVKFVVAGDGDQGAHMMQMASDLGIGHHVLFTGFLRGDDIQRVFSIADLYVMPSISEPFGIAPLEAMNNDVPALISKTSGVSELITHVLKVDFWDVDEMANKIIAVLRHPPLQQTLRQHGAMEVRRLTWDGAASRCEQVYDDVRREMTCAA